MVARGDAICGILAGLVFGMLFGAFIGTAPEHDYIALGCILTTASYFIFWTTIFTRRVLKERPLWEKIGCLQ